MPLLPLRSAETQFVLRMSQMKLGEIGKNAARTKITGDNTASDIFGRRVGERLLGRLSCQMRLPTSRPRSAFDAPSLVYRSDE